MMQACLQRKFSSDMNRNDLEQVRTFLHEYDGPEIRLMEVCGTHTASIAKNGIPALLSPSIHLISGPGCPVCVTVTDYTDRLVSLCQTPGTAVVSFGDLLRVKGSQMSLADARACGADVRMVYAPMQMLDFAAREPERTFVFAAVGFETTAPVYALMLEEAARLKLRNVKLLTSLKTMPEVIRTVVRARTPDGRGRIDGFLAPGHVCAVTGSSEYQQLAEETGLPFVVSGFSGPQLLASIAALVKLRGRGTCLNFYPEVVTDTGNAEAKALCAKYYEPCDASWRGLGCIPRSGLRLREEYRTLDAGSGGLDGDHAPRGCECAKVLTGQIMPVECPLFGRVCTPQNPNGACMVSQEGSCYNWYISGRTR